MELGGDPGDVSRDCLEQIFFLREDIEQKRKTIVQWQIKCDLARQSIPVFERRIEAAQSECNEKEKTIATLKDHILELRKRNEKLEFDLMNAYGRLDAEVEKYRYCGHGCPKCDQRTLDDLKKCF